MKLQRVTFGSNSQSETEKRTFRRRPNGRHSTVAVLFHRFGGLWLSRRSDFEVEVTWRDVEKLIDEFYKMRHPKAQEIRALRLFHINSERDVANSP